MKWLRKGPIEQMHFEMLFKSAKGIRERVRALLRSCAKLVTIVLRTALPLRSDENHKAFILKRQALSSARKCCSLAWLNGKLSTHSEVLLIF